MAPNAIKKARETLRERERELEHELRVIEQALKSLSGTARSPGRPKAGTAAGQGPGKRQSRSRRGGRTEQAMRLIAKNPSITVTELAKKMKLNAPNYLYRILPELERQGRITKDGTGYVVRQ